MRKENINIKKLKKYTEALKQVCPTFPSYCCYDAAAVLDYFEGLKSVSGYYIPKGEEENPSAWVEHYWNQDTKRGLEFDLTQHQFPKVNAKITVNKIGEGRLKRDEKVDMGKIYPNLQGYRDNLIARIKPLIDF